MHLHPPAAADPPNCVLFAAAWSAVSTGSHWNVAPAPAYPQASAQAGGGRHQQCMLLRVLPGARCARCHNTACLACARVGIALHPHSWHRLIANTWWHVQASQQPQALPGAQPPQRQLYGRSSQCAAPGRGREGATAGGAAGGGWRQQPANQPAHAAAARPAAASDGGELCAGHGRWAPPTHAGLCGIKGLSNAHQPMNHALVARVRTVCTCSMRGHAQGSCCPPLLGEFCRPGARHTQAPGDACVACAPNAHGAAVSSCARWTARPWHGTAQPGAVVRSHCPACLSIARPGRCFNIPH